MFELDPNMKTNQNMKIQSTMYAIKMIKKSFKILLEMNK